MKTLIKKTTAKLLLLTLCFTLSNCKKDDTAALSPEAQLQLQLTKGLEETLKPLNGSDPSLSSTDLSILDNLGQAKIVGMGEATHGTHEFFQMKHRIFQYLVEKQGFRYFAFEYDFAACLSLDYIIQTGQGTIAEYMKENMKFWTWKTEEVQSLFEWMQNYNRGKPDNQKIHVIGVDCQFTSFSIVQLIALLQIYDANYANVIKSRIGFYANSEFYKNQTFSTIQAVRAYVLPILIQIGEELKLKAAAITQATSPETYQIIQQLYLNITQAEILQYSTIINDSNSQLFRDQFMADNTFWIFNQFGDGKIAIWAHNGHVAKDDAYINNSGFSMGQHLKNKYGDNYQVIGFSLGEGQFNSTSNTSGKLEVFTIKEPQVGSINELFVTPKANAYIVNLSSLSLKNNWQARLKSLQPFLTLGSLFDPSKLSYYFQPIILQDQFDYIIHFDKTTASKFL